MTLLPQWTRQPQIPVGVVTRGRATSTRATTSIKNSVPPGSSEVVVLSIQRDREYPPTESLFSLCLSETRNSPNLKGKLRLHHTSPPGPGRGQVFYVRGLYLRPLSQECNQHDSLFQEASRRGFRNKCLRAERVPTTFLEPLEEWEERPSTGMASRALGSKRPRRRDS